MTIVPALNFKLVNRLVRYAYTLEQMDKFPWIDLNTCANFSLTAWDPSVLLFLLCLHLEALPSPAQWPGPKARCHTWCFGTICSVSETWSSASPNFCYHWSWFCYGSEKFCYRSGCCGCSSGRCFQIVFKSVLSNFKNRIFTDVEPIFCASAASRRAWVEGKTWTAADAAVALTVQLATILTWHIYVLHSEELGT